ncbi:tagaturonate epimerase family protein [Dorea sp. D27]|uniref:tagaturonate epimerase family protein n=1 Tax=Dorea sp. D27 TaxID=658665 RepID=UPI00067391A4|nr:tagaturonate epimerase family protein [Dorea sp. D27]KMZ53778.1 hypothetical protein HMPREF0980_02169 [Dorea sp. D27]
MDRYIEKIRQAMPDGDIWIKESTYAQTEGLRAIYATAAEKECLIVDGCKAFLFEGETVNGIKICPLNHINRLALNMEIGYTRPQSIGAETASFGCGDRLGLANEGQLAAVRRTRVKPVLAQQSLRELDLTGRSYDDVIDAASWAVFKAGYREGYGADGDHLKTKQEVEAALEHGCSMITLDCSDVLREPPVQAEALSRAYDQIPDKKRLILEEEYRNLPHAASIGVTYTRQTWMEVLVTYLDALELAEEIYVELIRSRGRRIDYEISLDETAHTTSAAAHYFVARELKKRHVRISSIAPKFIGEFQKGIDYIGDTEDFRRNLRMHCKVAACFGHKVSIHSGSDKFKVFPVIADETKGLFHVKTSGTSWLEAVRVIAGSSPDLYRRMHRKALEHLDEARSYYEVNCDMSAVRPLDTAADDELPAYIEQVDSRQLMHITYGILLNDTEMHDAIYEFLKKNEKIYEMQVKRHMEKHLKSLGCL